MTGCRIKKVKKLSIIDLTVLKNILYPVVYNHSISVLKSSPGWMEHHSHTIDIELAFRGYIAHRSSASTSLAAKISSALYIPGIVAL